MINKITTPTKILLGLAWLNLILWILDGMEVTHFGIDGYLGIFFVLLCLLILFIVMREKSQEMKSKR